MVAHDLKNPISLIIGIAELLKMDYEADQLGHIPEYIDSIVKNAYKTNNIVESLLLLSKQRYKDVKTMPLDMVHIVYEVLERLTPFIKEAQAEITLSVDWPTVEGYAPWVEEVWVNYLSNAIKYGGQPAKITLGATPQDDGFVRFWVSDNGPGLTPQQQAKLFTPFTRLSDKQIEGTGLGLSIVKNIVEKLGGEVGVESKVGEPGSIFYFTLPTISLS
jgi:signal transduction histidine kinase